MAEKLHFSLVSPEREVYVGEVDQVDAPGSEGDFGGLAGHAPFMTALRKIVLYSTNGVTTFVQSAMLQALKTPEAEIAPAESWADWPGLGQPDAYGSQILPGEAGADGFYYAALTKQ